VRSRDCVCANSTRGVENVGEWEWVHGLYSTVAEVDRAAGNGLVFVGVLF
jgi:hypothetical protein